VFFDIPSLKTWLDTPNEMLRVVSDRDKRRLKYMRAAFQPNDLTVVRDDFHAVRDGLVAAQSLDDLNLALGPEANATALMYERRLAEKYGQLSAAS
jgi:hypothetical protein